MILIIDGNNHLHRAYHRFNGFTNMDGKPSGVIYGFLTMTLGMIAKFKPEKTYVVFD